MLNTPPTPVCGILYIDDEEKALKYFRMAFGQKFQVFTAASGSEGVDLLRREAKHIGIVISDQRMPGMLGAEVLGVVREEFPQIVRILTTAYSDLESAIQAVNQGHIYQYVVKPWEIPDLGMVLQRAADYFLVTAERNELLALKMSTLQRIVCSDRLKGLLLAVRDWPEDQRADFLGALSALIKGLPSRAESVHSDSRSFQPRDFEIGVLIREGFQSSSQFLDAVRHGGASAGSVDSLGAALGLAVGEFHATGENGRWTVDLAGSVSRTELGQALFGALLGREIPPACPVVFQTLMKLSRTKGSLAVRLHGDAVAEFDLSAPAPTPEEIIDALYEKISSWDIASR